MSCCLFFEPITAGGSISPKQGVNITEISKWNEIVERWTDLLRDLCNWSLSYCSFAPFIPPWNMTKYPLAAVVKTQKTTPGIFKQKEKLLEKYFNISFLNILKHPSFEWNVKYHYVEYSQEFVEFLIEKIYPECLPFQDLNSPIIEERASFYPKDKHTLNREINPDINMPSQRQKDLYNKKFGEASYELKFGIIKPFETGAKPWNWESFQFK